MEVEGVREVTKDLSRLQVVGERRGQVRTQRIHRGDAGGPEEAQVRREEELQRLFGASYSGTFADMNKEETLSGTRSIRSP